MDVKTYIVMLKPPLLAAIQRVAASTVEVSGRIGRSADLLQALRREEKGEDDPVTVCRRTTRGLFGWL
jgi:hypothetical protein